MLPKIGLIFTHAFWLDADNRHLRMRVTKIAKGVVYYRPVDGGNSSYCDIQSFSRYALEP